MKLPIADIKPNPDNPRLIKDDKFKKLVQSLKDFPEMAEVREVVVNKDHMILGGNMRYKAMLEAGWKEIPIKVVDWPEDKQKEFIIKDNISGGEWDWDIIANEWDSKLLDDWGLDLPNGFGEEEVEEDEAPEVSKDPPQSVLGAVYQLGRHKLMCGDSTVKKHINGLLDGYGANMIFTDPPYGVDYQSRVDEERRKGWGKIANDDLKGEELQDFIAKSLLDLVEVPTYVCCNWQSYTDFEEALGKPNSLIVWDKGSIGLGAGYRNQHEFILFYGTLDHNSESNVWSITRDAEYKHPTQKPIEIPARAIRNSTKSNKNIVLDPFGGSGSTLIACEQLDRTCYMMELDPKYCDVIRKRYWKFINNNDETGWEDGTPIISEGAAKNA